MLLYDKKAMDAREITIELEKVGELLKPVGFELEPEQPHISGERFLMMKEKLVLVGKRIHDSKKVIIKVSNEESGKKEIDSEKRTYDFLKKVAFTTEHILLPTPIYYNQLPENYLVLVTEFIPQEKVFVNHSLEEQFFLILRAFEEQESFHATTFEHMRKIREVFPVSTTEEYFQKFNEFIRIIQKNPQNEHLNVALCDALNILEDYRSSIDTFSNHLTHTDFVPHNFRVHNRKIYMLDLTAVHFGNKYEGWARFLNYMIIHNPPLEKALSDYVRKNRGETDYLNLRLMRIYKIGFLLKYYAESLEKTSGDLKQLTLERINFWHEILKYILEDTEIPHNFVEEYKSKRDTLRSEEEKKRQKEFAVS
jgi:hypothetical protein